MTAASSVADLLARPEVAAAWDQPSALAEWKVSGLAGHLGDQASARGHAARAPSESDQEPITLDEHYRRAAWVGAAVDDEVRASTSAPPASATRPRGRTPCWPGCARPVEALPAVLAATAPDRPVLIPWQGWALRRDDFLTVRMMEITVHSDDLAASVGITAPELPDEVLGPVLGLLTRLAVRRHGQSAVVDRPVPRRARAGRINAF